ncbi:MAG: hypothetical protein KDA25_00330 [Phycisphaerales bacterium]|nr:hypothetical protein [Phycisphaerales bacterium]
MKSKEFEQMHFTTKTCSIGSIACGLTLLGAVPAAADVGDEIAVITVPVSGADTFCSIGCAFDGGYLHYTRCGDENIYKIDPLSGALIDTFASGIPEFPNAISYDATRNAIWIGCQGCNAVGMPIYLWHFGADGDPNTADDTVTHEFDIPFGLLNPATGNPFLGFCFIDGIAFDAFDPNDPNDDGLWVSDDVDDDLGLFALDGSLINGYAPASVDPSLATTSGLAVGGPRIYLANNGGGDVFRADKFADPLTLVDQFENGNDRQEDMECDPVTFAPIEVMWVRTTPQGGAFPDVITAYEIEPGSCGLGGAPGASCEFEVQEVLCNCNPDGGTDGYSVNLNLVNNSGVDAYWVLLPGFNTVPNIVPLVPPLANGESRKIDIDIVDVDPGEFCFYVVLADINIDECCSAEVCVDLPECDCFQLLEKSVDCLPDGSGDYVLTFTFQNLTEDVIYHSFLIAPPGITVSPDYIAYDPGLAHCDSATVNVIVSGAGAGEEVCILFSIHNIDLLECCADFICCPAPDCAPQGPCPGKGDCCAANGTPGCEQPECCEAICAADPFCCDTEWDGICANAALANPLCDCFVEENNDDCEDRFDIFDGQTGYSTIGATTDGLPHAVCMFDGQTYNDIWYNYVATCDGTLTVTTCDAADYDTDLAVYNGCDVCPPGDNELAGCNDDDSACAGFTSTVMVGVSAGNCYKIRVGGWNAGDSGNGTVTITCTPGIPEDGCFGDLNGDGVVGPADLSILLSEWGSSSSIADLNHDRNVNSADLAMLLAAWGSCS